MNLLWKAVLLFAVYAVCISGGRSENDAPEAPDVGDGAEEPVTPVNTPVPEEETGPPGLSEGKVQEETPMGKTTGYSETSSTAESVASSMTPSTETVTEEPVETTKKEEVIITTTTTAATTTTTTTTAAAVSPTGAPTESASPESVTTESGAVTGVKEKPPANTFAVWNQKDKICLLAKFHAVFTITYPSRGGNQSVSAELPKNAVQKGKCGEDVESPVLSLSWDEFSFTITFSKVKKETDKWVVTRLSLRYDTSVPLFDGATNSGKKTAQSKDVELFETDLGKSYNCPTAKAISLYKANKKVATVSMSDMHLQPFEVEDGKFAEAQRCDEVSINSPEVPAQDETIPLAVGLTLTILTLIIVLGLSIRRAYTMRKVDYNSME